MSGWLVVLAVLAAIPVSGLLLGWISDYDKRRKAKAAWTHEAIAARLAAAQEELRAAEERVDSWVLAHPDLEEIDEQAGLRRDRIGGVYDHLRRNVWVYIVLLALVFVLVMSATDGSRLPSDPGDCDPRYGSC